MSDPLLIVEEGVNPSAPVVALDAGTLRRIPLPL